MGGATDGLRQLVVVEDEDAQLFQALEGAGVDEADAVGVDVRFEIRSSVETASRNLDEEPFQGQSQTRNHFLHQEHDRFRRGGGRGGGGGGGDYDGTEPLH